MGQGSFGQVVKAQDLKTGEFVAIKLIERVFEDAYHSKKVLRELQILRQLSKIANNEFTT